jgi:C4-dicarboxylate transporter DctM subunit
MMAIPFFILAGEIMNSAGITQHLLAFAKTVIGRVRGGMMYVVILANMIMAGVSGSSVADACAIGTITIPAMEKDGYKRDFATALNGASATIGPIIPPSMGFVMYAAIVGCSVGDLFLAGVLPGILMGVAFGVVCYYKARRENLPLSEETTLKERLYTARRAIWALFMPIVIIGGILIGLVTPTEAAVLACVYGLLIGFFIYRTLKLKDIPLILFRSAKSSISVMIIVACASAFGWMLTVEGTPQALIKGFTAISSESWAFLLLLNLIFLVLGCILDVDTLIIVFVPLLIPALALYKIDLVYFGVVFTLNTMVGQLTPPVGELLYAVSSVGKTPILKTSRQLIPFYIALVITLFIVTYIPMVPMMLPRLFGYGG